MFDNDSSIVDRGLVSFMRGQRAYYGYLKFKMVFAHVNTQALALAQAATTSAETAAAGSANLLGTGLPQIVRFCVVMLKGRDVDALGNVYRDFNILKPFPTGSSKYTK